MADEDLTGTTWTDANGYTRHVIGRAGWHTTPDVWTTTGQIVGQQMISGSYIRDHWTRGPEKAVRRLPDTAWVGEHVPGGHTAIESDGQPLPSGEAPDACPHLHQTDSTDFDANPLAEAVWVCRDCGQVCT